MEPEIEINDLCDQRTAVTAVAGQLLATLVCALPDDGHAWHWDPVDDVTWKRGRNG